MQIGVLGSGITGQTIGSKLIQLGHEVMLGSRKKPNPPAVAWARDLGGQHALYGTFMNAAAFGEIIFNCTLGSASLDALEQAGADNLKDKILIDTSNPLDRSTDQWSLTVCNTDSLGEQIQRAYPETQVIKTLNAVNANVMVDPAKLLERTHVLSAVMISKPRLPWSAILRRIGSDGRRSSTWVGSRPRAAWKCMCCSGIQLRNAISSQRFNIKVVTSWI